MDFSLTEEQQALKNGIVHFAKKELNGNMIERDRNQEFPRALWDKCGTMGLQGLPVDEKYGGLGLSALSTAIALEGLGYGCEDGGLVFSLCAHLLACVIPVWKYGTEEQKGKYLKPLASGEWIAVNGMTEPSSGSDAFNMATRAVPDGRGFRINGTKTLCSNAPVADVALLYAVTDPDKHYYGGISAFLIDAGTAGLRSSQKFEKMGLRTSPIGELVLEDVHAPEGSVLGGLGAGPTVFGYSMDWERTCIGATHLGTMQRLLEKAVKYSCTRKSSGRKIASYQAVSHKIADMKIRLEASRSLIYRAAWSLDQGKNATMDASIAKVFASEALIKCASDTLQILGGYGFMTEYEVERTVRDSLGGTIYSGPNEVQRNIIARWLGL